MGNDNSPVAPTNNKEEQASGKAADYSADASTVRLRSPQASSA